MKRKYSSDGLDLLNEEKKPALQIDTNPQPGTRTAQRTFQLLDKEGINRFLLAIQEQDTDTIKTLWCIPLLRDYFAGKHVACYTRQTQTVRNFKISLKKLRMAFKVALEHSFDAFISYLWNNNSVLRDYFKGRTIVNRKSGAEFQISFNALIENFQAALNSGCVTLINDMWNSDERLRDHISGKSPLSTDPEVMIRQFHWVLNSACLGIINAVWRYNSPLHDAIFKLPIQDKKLLLEKVTKIRKYPYYDDAFFHEIIKLLYPADLVIENWEPDIINSNLISKKNPNQSIPVMSIFNVEKPDIRIPEKIQDATNLFRFFEHELQELLDTDPLQSCVGEDALNLF